MRCDGEPSTLALLEACVKTCCTLGIRVVPEPTAIGDHQSNGGAGRAVELIRSHANTLVTHLEGCCKAAKKLLVAVTLSMVLHSADTQSISGFSRSDCL